MAHERDGVKMNIENRDTKHSDLRLWKCTITIPYYALTYSQKQALDIAERFLREALPFDHDRLCEPVFCLVSAEREGPDTVMTDVTSLGYMSMREAIARVKEAME